MIESHLSDDEADSDEGEEDEEDNFDLLNSIVDSVQDVVEIVKSLDFDAEAVARIFDKAFLAESNVRVDGIVNVVGIFWTVVETE